MKTIVFTVIATIAVACLSRSAMMQPNQQLPSNGSLNQTNRSPLNPHFRFQGSNGIPPWDPNLPFRPNGNPRH